MNYVEQAREARKAVLRMIYKAQTSHIGSNFSCIDLLAVLFDKMHPEQDKFICSKGWVAASVYYFLAQKGIILKEDLERYCAPDEREYIGLIEPRGKFGLEFAGGSMGYGLPAGVGYALTKKQKGECGHVYVLMSDGEMQIGTTWESAMIAAHHELTNLTVIVDYNGFQAMGRVHDILSLGDLHQKWKSFGWLAHTVNGHKYSHINGALLLRASHMPTIILAETTKGKGVSFMEDNNTFHYKAPSESEYNRALAKLNG